MEEQTSVDNTNWLEKESEQLNTQPTYDGAKLPGLQLEEGKTVSIQIDFSEPFKIWDDTENKTLKKIIPVKHEEVDKLWWLNVKNPIYREIVNLGKGGQTKFKVIQVGKNQNTKYSLVKD